MAEALILLLKKMLEAVEEVAAKGSQSKPENPVNLFCLKMSLSSSRPETALRPSAVCTMCYLYCG